MYLYQINDQKLEEIKQINFEKEKPLHDIIENNLEELFSLKLVDGEHQIEGYFLDSLGYDPEVNSFVIIEYKRDKQDSVVDQGLHYLQLMLTHKADFVLIYNNKFGKNLSAKDFDWTQIKVIFIAQSFTAYQQGAINFQDFPIELWEVAKYKNNLLSLNQIKANKKADSITKIIKSSAIEQISREIKTFTVNDLFKSDWVDSKELYEEIREKIMNLNGNLLEDFRKYYIGYKFGRLNVVTIEPRKERLDLVLLRTELKNLKDPEKKATYKKDSYRFFNQHQCVVKIFNSNDIDYAVLLAKQVVESFIKNHQ